tara:strand:+ start:3146 stop:3886 length:741 start_codon:yes stop_codon:yes gene_type:complete
MLKVYAHPRSGINYLAALLKRNFYSDVNVKATTKWGHHSNIKTSEEAPDYGALIGGYGGPKTKHNGPSIYIYRDGRAVAWSMYKNKDFLTGQQRHHMNDYFGFFLRSKIDWKYCPMVEDKADINIAQAWEKHVRDWHSAYRRKELNKILFVRYEEVISDVPRALLKISKEFGLKMPKRISYVKEVVGPSEERLNLEWQQMFSRDQYNYFHKFVLRDSEFLYYKPSSIPQMVSHDEMAEIEKINIFK